MINKDRIIALARAVYTEGNRYTFITALAGSLAKSNVPIEIAYDIYSGISDLDDEDRTHIIDSAYSRVEVNLPVKTLYSLKDIPEYAEIFKEFNLVFSPYKNIQRDKPLIIPEYKPYKETYINLDDISIPFDKSIHLKELEYLQSRKIDENDIEEFGIRVGVRKLFGYIVFPIYDKYGNCVYYVSRNYLGKQPKYKNSTKEKSRYLWNYYSAVNKSKTIVVFEGIINAITAYKYLNRTVPTTALLGKTLSKYQFILLNNFDNIIFNFDGDVSGEYVEKIAKDFDGKKIEYIKMPLNRDVNDMSKEEYIKHFINKEVLRSGIV